MRRHRYQPILDAETLEVNALEVLSIGPLPLADEAEMLRVDMECLEYGLYLMSETGHRIHCNMEYSTLVLVPRLVAEMIRPGIVIELVERHEILDNSEIHDMVAEAATMIRNRGGVIAMDDVTPTTLERKLIKTLRPEIIKVDNMGALTELRKSKKNVLIIAERIETANMAELALKLGAKEIQGFWCDQQVARKERTRMDENALPTSLVLSHT